MKFNTRKTAARRVLTGIVVFWIAASGLESATTAAEPFRVRGFHVPFRPSNVSLSQYQKLMEELAGRGYNAVFLSLGATGVSTFTIPEPGLVTTKGFTVADLQMLIRHARSRGLEPVLEIKMIGKQRPVLGELAKNLPGLLCQHHGRSPTHELQVINPNYRLPDGRNVFEAIVFPEIDYFLNLYGADKPEYLLLGIDEFSVDDLDACAKQSNMTAAELFADALNRITAHVLEKGSTPIIWGDMLLSHRLAQPGHGVKGFDHDPRMSHPQFAYHAEFQSKNGVSVLTAMNSLRRRGEIIVADWQYGPGDPNGEFPSVDYFQKMGFKDVWGTTWHNLTGIRNFSRYTARRGCGGMIASTWHMFLARDMKPLLPVILQNSIVYFKNPNFNPPPENLPITITSERASLWTAATLPAFFPPSTRSLLVQARVPAGVLPTAAVLRVQGAFGRLTSLTAPIETPLTHLPQDSRLEGRVTLPAAVAPLPMMFDTCVEFTCADSGYLVQSRQRNSFGIGAQPPPLAGVAPPDALFYADFSGLTARDGQSRLLQVGGRFGGLLFIESPQNSKPPPSGALDCRWASAAYAYPPAAIWDTIYTDGLRLRVEFRISGAPSGQFPAILGCGTFHSGFRILLGPNRQIILNIARGKDGFSPLQIACPHKVPVGQWTTLEMILSPPDAQRQRIVSLQVGDAEPILTRLPIDIVKAPQCPLSLGVEFDSAGRLAGSKSKKFPGLIRKVELFPYANRSKPL